MILPNQTLDSLLKLGRQLHANNKTLVVMLAGGFYIQLLHNSISPLDEVTQTDDLNIFLSPIVNSIAKEHNLPETWFDEAIESIIQSNPSRYAFLKIPELEIYGVAIEYFLSLKVYLFDGSIDEQNQIVSLANKLELKSLNDFSNIMAAYFNTPELSPQAIEFISKLYASKNKGKPQSTMSLG